MINKTKIAICVAIVVGTASAGFAKDQNARRDRAEAVVETNGHSFGQARVAGSGSCWVPMRDQNDDEYGADTRGLGYWGSCREKGAVPTK